MSVDVEKDDVNKVLLDVALLVGSKVYVGIPSENAGRRDGPINNAALGYIHENGAPEVNIPARPFLVPGVSSATDVIAKDLEEGARAALDGNAAKVEAQMNIAGQHAADAVRRRITDGPFVPLRPATLASRRRRGNVGTKPLIDTGQLRAAVTYTTREQE